ncbi:MAG: OB-fold nucleic acid binding domain-containing protein, partial [Lachnospiraceae bacterium]
NPEEGVPGCIANGIDEAIANKIYDEMTDFAKYAFNKSHAAAYAVVSYQTAYLKYYYPVAFMAALMTSVMDNVSKVSEYIMTCRQMGIKLLPPDINEGQAGFSVSGNAIRYGLSAIKSIGRPMIAALIQERQERGPFTTLKDFAERMSGKEMNKRAVENFIKAGAMDCFEGNRKQLMHVYGAVMDSVSKEKKSSMAGQMSLFDLVPEEDKKDFDIQLPNVPEFEKEELLFMEKEVLGVYISGHPLEEYAEKWQKNITRVTSDFYVDEDTNLPHVTDGEVAMVGGMITECTIKYTKTNKTMAFLTVEDLVGTVEIIVFPRDYEKYHHLMQTDQKIFVKGRVSVEEEKNGKLICEKIYSFDEAKRELWLQFETMEKYEQQMQKVQPMLDGSDGSDQVVIYISSLKAMKRLGPNRTVLADLELLEVLKGILGEKNVKVVEKSIENLNKRG